MIAGTASDLLAQACALPVDSRIPDSHWLYIAYKELVQREARLRGGVTKIQKSIQREHQSLDETKQLPESLGAVPSFEVGECGQVDSEEAKRRLRRTIAQTRHRLLKSRTPQAARDHSQLLAYERDVDEFVASLSKLRKEAQEGALEDRITTIFALGQGQQPS